MLRWSRPGLLHGLGGVPWLVLIQRGSACIFWRREASRERGTYRIRWLVMSVGGVGLWRCYGAVGEGTRRWGDWCWVVGDTGRVVGELGGEQGWWLVLCEVYMS